MTARWKSVGSTIVGVLLTLGLLGALLFLMLRVTEQDSTIDQLSRNNDALREQVNDLGQNPVAPPAESVTGNSPSTGQPGPSGDAGPRGPQGDPGRPPTAAEIFTAVDVYCAAHNACQGAPGLPGRDGLNGAPSTVPGPQGPAGTASTVPGPQGPQGEPGTAGAPGTPGANGRGVNTIECQADGSWLITYTDGSTSTTSGPCRIPDPTPTPTPEVLP